MNRLGMARVCMVHTSTKKCRKEKKKSTCRARVFGKNSLSSPPQSSHDTCGTPMEQLNDKNNIQQPHPKETHISWHVWSISKKWIILLDGLSKSWQFYLPHVASGTGWGGRRLGPSLIPPWFFRVRDLICGNNMSIILFPHSNGVKPPSHKRKLGAAISGACGNHFFPNA